MRKSRARPSFEKQNKQRNAYLWEFQFALMSGSISEVTSLLDEHSFLATVENVNGLTGLQLAAMLGRVNDVELLISRGAEINARAGGSGGTAIQFATLATDTFAAADSVFKRQPSTYSRDYLKVQDILLSNGAENDGWLDEQVSELHEAAKRGDTMVVSSMLADGFDVDSRTSQGDTPLHWAARAGDLSMIELLIANGADVNSRANDLSTPLHRSVAIPQMEPAMKLLENGAKINATTAAGSTPLHWAAGSDNEIVVNLLISKGADVNIKDDYGHTALDAAATWDYKNIVRALLDVPSNRQKTAPPRADFLPKDFVRNLRDS